MGSMSDRMTSISPLRGLRTESGRVIPGQSVYGRSTRAEMIEMFRQFYQQQLEEAQAALALTDDQLVVKTYVGAWARKGEQVVTE
jgi:hypothetical protein